MRKILNFNEVLKNLPDIKDKDNDTWTDGKYVLTKNHEAVCAVYDLLCCIYPDQIFQIKKLSNECFGIKEI